MKPGKGTLTSGEAIELIEEILCRQRIEHCDSCRAEEALRGLGCPSADRPFCGSSG